MISKRSFAHGVLIREGSSDDGLTSVIESTLMELGFFEVFVDIAIVKGSYSEKVAAAVKKHPVANLYFIHVDTDGKCVNEVLRRINVSQIEEDIGFNSNTHLVALVPHTETESWILAALTDRDFARERGYESVMKGVTLKSISGMRDAKEFLKEIVKQKQEIMSGHRGDKVSFNQERRRLLSDCPTSPQLANYESYQLFVDRLDSIMVE